MLKNHAALDGFDCEKFLEIRLKLAISAPDRIGATRTSVLSVLILNGWPYSRDGSES